MPHQNLGLDTTEVRCVQTVGANKRIFVKILVDIFEKPTLWTTERPETDHTYFPQSSHLERGGRRYVWNVRAFDSVLQGRRRDVLSGGS